MISNRRFAVVSIASILALAIVWFAPARDGFAGRAVANAAESAAPAGAAPAAGSRDAQIVEYLQKRLRLSSPQLVQLGPLQPSGISGLFTRSVLITNDQGMKANLTMFQDSMANKVIVGQLLDLGQDPWARIDPKVLHLDDRPSMGPADAPVTIVEFGDFECPFCARALTMVESLVNAEYKGQVRLVFKNYPLSGHVWAKPAAFAAECVRMQNPSAFWDFAHDLYRDQGAINPANLQQHIDGYASSLKLDSKALGVCMKAKSTEARIIEDQQDGMNAKVNSTPTFFVNGIPVVGFPDPKALSFVVASELKPHPASAAK
jgi:protein-disulfide isomerase